MSYFLFNGKLEVESTEKLVGDELRHILQSRRLKIGEHLQIQDIQGHRFEAVLQNISKKEIQIKVIKKVSVPSPSPLNLELLIGLPKEKSLDFILQKCTELGIQRLIVFAAKYSPKKPTGAQLEHLHSRWKKIAEEACKQSGRQFPPEILWFNSLEEALTALCASSKKWILVPEKSKGLPPSWFNSQKKEISKNQLVLIGPEGGFSPEEIEISQKYGMDAICLGPRILRTETAAIAIASIFQFLIGDMAGFSD